MITVYPSDSDWEAISQIAQTYDATDRSWDPDNMRSYFERIERCGYIPRANADASMRHGFDGWLGTSVADLALALGDFQLLAVILTAAGETFKDLIANKGFGDILEQLEIGLEIAGALKALTDAQDPNKLEAAKLAIQSILDPNRYTVTQGKREGVFLVPLAVADGLRNGSRERVLQAQRQFPDNLTTRFNTFVTKVVIEDGKAVGVECVEGERLYQAAPVSDLGGNRPSPGTPYQVRASREVILAGGTFNTPQLLMLSGIGPKADLDALGIPVLLDRPAVGGFLQDRYEVAVISQSPADFSILEDLTFKQPPADPKLLQWEQTHDGIYATNGAIVSIIRKSSPDKVDPDLFIFGLPASFKGYYPFYADALESTHNQFTWAILKAHTNNKGGHVGLASKDPLARPTINFHYFEEGTDASGDDLAGVVEGVKFVRGFARKLNLACRLLTRKAVQPGPDINDDAQVAQWVKDEAWGHHACGTCRMGPSGDLQQAVLDTRFRVQGVDGLRVVDASVFPSIPGMFIVSSIYMIAEKASEDILRDAGRPLPAVNWQPLPDDTWIPRSPK